MSAALAALVLAQAMPGMAMPPGHAHMPGMAMPPAAAKPSAAAPEVGDAPAPKPPGDFYAERVFSSAEMARARAILREEHGGGRFGLVGVPILEAQAHGGRDDYEWNGEGWYGSDRHRLVVRSEGHGERGRRPEDAEAQLLYGTPIDPYWDVQVGIRQDFRRGERPTFAVLAAEGLAPYWIEVEASLFLSDAGDLTARVEAMHDARITQRLIAQPRVELNLAAQDVPATRTGAGLSDAEIGLRLRYEIVREIAPYVGVQYRRRFGDGRRFAGGAEGGGTSLVIGVATFF